MELADAQRAGVFNLAGVCLGHTGHAARASSVLDLLIGNANDLGRTSRRVGRPRIRGMHGTCEAFARGLGVCARGAQISPPKRISRLRLLRSRHLEMTLTAIAKAARCLEVAHELKCI